MAIITFGGDMPTPLPVEQEARSNARDLFQNFVEHSDGVRLFSSQPITETHGLEGLVVVGHTLPELQYTATQADEYFLGAFERLYFTPINTSLVEYSRTKETHDLKLALRGIEIAQETVPLLREEGTEYKLVCTDGKATQWAAKVQEKIEQTKGQAQQLVNCTLAEILEGVEMASPEVRDDKIKRAGDYLTGYGYPDSLSAAIRRLDVKIMPEHQQRRQEYWQVSVLKPKKDENPDPFAMLLKPETPYLQGSAKVFWKNAREMAFFELIASGALGGLVGLSLLISDSGERQKYSDSITLDQVQNFGMWALGGMGIVGLGHAVISAGKETYRRYSNRKTLARYEGYFGGKSIENVDALQEEVVFRVDHILREQERKFVTMEELERRVFPTKPEDSGYYNLIHHAVSLISQRGDVLVEIYNPQGHSFVAYRIMPKIKLAA